jgi:hypothetical protein
MKVTPNTNNDLLQPVLALLLLIAGNCQNQLIDLILHLLKVAKHEVELFYISE